MFARIAQDDQIERLHSLACSRRHDGQANDPYMWPRRGRVRLSAKSRTIGDMIGLGVSNAFRKPFPLR